MAGGGREPGSVGRATGRFRDVCRPLILAALSWWFLILQSDRPAELAGPFESRELCAAFATLTYEGPPTVSRCFKAKADDSDVIPTGQEEVTHYADGTRQYRAGWSSHGK